MRSDTLESVICPTAGSGTITTTRSSRNNQEENYNTVGYTQQFITVDLRVFVNDCNTTRRDTPNSAVRSTAARGHGSSTTKGQQKHEAKEQNICRQEYTYNAQETVLLVLIFRWVDFIAILIDDAATYHVDV